MSVPKYLGFEIITKVDHENGYLPHRANPTDAGADIKSAESTSIPPGETVLISTGISVKIPMGYVGLVFSKSGQALKGVSLGNSVGVIDSDYRGEIKVPLINHSKDWYPILTGQKIAQLVIMPIVLPTFTKWEGEEGRKYLDPYGRGEFTESWVDTERGTGGFGSTGL